MKNILDLKVQEIYRLIQTKEISEEEFENWFEDRLDETWQKAVKMCDEGIRK